MSDPYLDKVIAERAQEDLEVRSCPLCLGMTSPSRSLHIARHRQETAPTPRQRDADIEYSHDAPAEHYPYKSPGMDDAASMHPSRWREPRKAALPKA